MKITDTYLNNKKEIEKFLHTFSFEGESLSKIRQYIDNPVSVVNDDIKRLFEKYDESIVDFRIPLPASMLKQKKKYQREIYLIMSMVVDCLKEDDQFKFHITDDGEIIPDITLSPSTISENYFKIKNDKRKVWRYLDSKAPSIAKRIYENWFSNKTFSIDNDGNVTEFIDVFSNGVGLFSFIAIMKEYFLSLGTRKTSLKEKISKFVTSNSYNINVTGLSHSEAVNKLTTEVIKPFFNIIQEIISAKVLDLEKYKLYLSFNPFDWLLASSGETWHSCIDMASNYYYGIGMLGMCGCPDWGMVLYTDGTKKEFGGIESYHIVTRSWVCYNADNKFQLINWYPKDMRSSVDFSGSDDIKFVQPGHSEESSRYSKSTWEPITFPNGSLAWIYSDLNSFNTTGSDDGKVRFKFDGRCGLPRMFKAEGKIYDDNDGAFDSVIRAVTSRYGSIWDAVCKGFSIKNSLSTPRVRSSYHCDCCGTGVDSHDDLTYIASEDIYVCNSCLQNNFFTCDHCGEYHRYDGDAIEIHYGSGSWEYELVCQACADEMTEDGRVFWDELDENYYSTESVGFDDDQCCVAECNVSRFINNGRLFRHSNGELYSYRENSEENGNG